MKYLICCFFVVSIALASITGCQSRGLQLIDDSFLPIGIYRSIDSNEWITVSSGGMQFFLQENTPYQVIGETRPNIRSATYKYIRAENVADSHAGRHQERGCRLQIITYGSLPALQFGVGPWSWDGNNTLMRHSKGGPIRALRFIKRGNGVIAPR